MFEIIAVFLVLIFGTALYVVIDSIRESAYIQGYEQGVQDTINSHIRQS